MGCSPLIGVPFEVIIGGVTNNDFALIRRVGGLQYDGTSYR